MTKAMLAMLGITYINGFVNKHASRVGCDPGQHWNDFVSTTMLGFHRGDVGGHSFLIY